MTDQDNHHEPVPVRTSNVVIYDVHLDLTSPSIQGLSAATRQRLTLDALVALSFQIKHTSGAYIEIEGTQTKLAEVFVNGKVSARYAAQLTYVKSGIPSGMRKLPAIVASPPSKGIIILRRHTPR